ncbi:MAG: carboxynorspermidine decarboxylase [Prevotella sp.]|nr:carboxynorspermidine decarboxylase [Bacteroides sp.]MCM1365910.1 carboxynorspermidine decarboxylase [Prevotella sp.]
MSIKTPYYIVYEDKLRRNLELISDIARKADIKIIMAFKANALWKTFPIIKEYCTSSTASSLNEMMLSREFLGDDVHTYCPVYTDDTFPKFLEGSSHITFNSLAQFHKFYPQIKDWNETNPYKRVSAGLRVNPKCSVIETDIYNPCVPGSRFGEKAEILESLPDGLEGLHFHALCESDSKDLEKVLKSFESQFGHLLSKIKWLNMGGGHLMTRKGYDIDLLISLMHAMHQKYPHLQIIMEPGSAFTWQTGDLVTEVLDVVEDSGIHTAIIDASFACHMPDCLEMPYQPEIQEAFPLDSGSTGYNYRLGGNSCLSGDFVGEWQFKDKLKPGNKLTLKDMNHYTTVKTNMFNGIQHPSIWLKPIDGEPVLLREYTYEDYRNRMD